MIVILLPVLLAFRRSDDEERTFWRRCISEGKQNGGDLERAMELLEKHDALHDSIERARHYGSMARDGLGIFPEGEAKRALTDVVDFCIERAY